VITSDQNFEVYTCLVHLRIMSVFLSSYQQHIMVRRRCR